MSVGESGAGGARSSSGSVSSGGSCSTAVSAPQSSSALHGSSRGGGSSSMSSSSSSAKSPPQAGVTGGLGTEDGSAPGIGSRRGGRGPSGVGGTSPNRGASSGRRPAAWPASMAAAASSAPMMRTLSLDGRGPRFSRGSSLSFPVRSSTRASGSDLEQLVLLVLHHAVDLFHVFVGEFVELTLGALEIVGRDVARLLQAVELVAGGAPQVAYGDAAFLGLVLHDLHKLLTPLLGELRERQADDLAVVGGVDTEVGVLDGLLDGLHRVLVVGLDDEKSSLGHVEARQLLQRHLGAVIVDLQLLDKRRRRSPGAHAGELRLRVPDGLCHLVRDLDQNVVDHRAPPSAAAL